MIKIYHNNRCSKSRCGLEIVKESGKEFEIVNYLVDAPSFTDLEGIIALLDISPIELIRKNEGIWKDKYKGLSLSNDELINAMVEHPKLIERPIVINGNKAIIGRPPERIKTIL